MKNQGLKELYINELKDLYSAETQLVKALPKMAKGAVSEKLRQGFEHHLEQTKGHVERLDQIFVALGENPKGKKCVGMEGIVKEGAEALNGDYEGNILDAALISAAQRVEHYEIAAYGSARAMAEELSEVNHADLLSETLAEEKETHEKLTDLSSEAYSGVSSNEDGEGIEEEDQNRISNSKGKKNPRKVA
jgi:ferritin-like metal-binding protein YciE